MYSIFCTFSFLPPNTLGRVGKKNSGTQINVCWRYTTMVHDTVKPTTQLKNILNSSLLVEKKDQKKAKECDVGLN